MNNKPHSSDYSKPTNFQEFKKRYLARGAEAREEKKGENQVTEQHQAS